MKCIIWLVAFLFMPAAANAAMFKCTDAEGDVSFSDKPCPEQNQEVLKHTSATPSASTSATTPEPSSIAQPEITPIEALTGGKKVTGASPLAKAYTAFRAAARQCDRDEMMRHVSSKMAEGLSAATNREFKDGCKALKLFLHSDFKDATEVIDGNRGTIQWLTVETTTDDSGTMSMKSEQSERFVKENGVWKYGE